MAYPVKNSVSKSSLSKPTVNPMVDVHRLDDGTTAFHCWVFVWYHGEIIYTAHEQIYTLGTALKRVKRMQQSMVNMLESLGHRVAYAQVSMKTIGCYLATQDEIDDVARWIMNQFPDLEQASLDEWLLQHGDKIPEPVRRYANQVIEASYAIA